MIVAADPDQPPRTSSITSKMELPLLETPNSISIIDRRTLDDLFAINISEWHEYQSDSLVSLASTTGRIEHRLVAGWY